MRSLRKDEIIEVFAICEAATPVESEFTVFQFERLFAHRGHKCIVIRQADHERESVNTSPLVMLLKIRVQFILKLSKFSGLKSTFMVFFSDDIGMGEPKLIEIGEVSGYSEFRKSRFQVIIRPVKNVRKCVVDALRVIHIIGSKCTDTGGQTGTCHQDQDRADRKRSRLKDDRILDLAEGKDREFPAGCFSSDNTDQDADPAEQEDRAQKSQDDSITERSHAFPESPRL